jgi:hypothetical protein
VQPIKGVYPEQILIARHPAKSDAIERRPDFHAVWAVPVYLPRYISVQGADAALKGEG